MNGAESLVRTLVGAGIDTCFANPGTSEMHFVAALDRVEGLRCVLGLAETVVTGCADGYARMAGRPAATLLHCGPGFANGIASLHNARRANAQIVNIVGDQATYHRPWDAALTADTEGLARAVSHWVRTSATARDVASDAAVAIQAARTSPGCIATLILPADAAWNEGAAPAQPLTPPGPAPVAPHIVHTVAALLRARPRAVIMLSGAALSEPGLRAAQRVVDATGARLLAPMQVARIARGRGRPAVDRLPFSLDRGLELLAGIEHLVLCGAKPPVGFFAYPGKPNTLWPKEATLHVLARPEQDLVAALESLADEVGASREPMVHDVPVPSTATGRFTQDGFGATLSALMPDNAIVAEDSVTSGRGLFPLTYGAAPHDWMQITGGAIGCAFPLATGAAVACPDRKVICLQADGGGMYTLQSLWTQARERLDVVNVIFANRAYAVLRGELAAVGATPGRASTELFDIGRPNLDWISLARGMGVEGARADTIEAFADLFRAACARRGPFLIELTVP